MESHARARERNFARPDRNIQPRAIHQDLVPVDLQIRADAHALCADGILPLRSATIVRGNPAGKPISLTTRTHLPLLSCASI